MRQILSLWFLQIRYLLLSLRSPRVTRDFWYHLYHEGRRADKLVRPSLKYRLPTKDVELIFPGIHEQPFSLEGYCEEYGAVSLQEVKYLAASIQMLKPRTLFEIGTFHGGTTVQLALNSPSEAIVNTLDLPEDHPLRADHENVDLSPERLGKRHQVSTVSGKIRQHYGNSMEFDFGPFAGGCDWVFVDAAHTYDYVMSDTRNALAILRPGGVVFWHDVNLAFEGTCQALEEFASRIPIVRIRGTTLACYRS
jgi:predicted O-methyltransferase YrrM